MSKRQVFNFPSPNIDPYNVSFSATATSVIDAAAEKLFFYGVPWHPDWRGGSKNISQVIIVPSTVTQGTGTTTVRVGLSDIAASPGEFPPRDDGVLDQSGSIALTSVVSNVPLTITLDSARAINFNDRVGVVVEFSEFGTGPALSLRTNVINVATGYTTGISEYIGAPAWTARTAYPNIVLVCDDGSRLYLGRATGNMPISVNSDYNSATTGTGIDSGDERGNLWIPRSTWDITDLTALVRASTSPSADFDVVLYRDDTVLWSKSYEGDQLTIVNTHHVIDAAFDTPIRVNAGENIRMTVKATTVENIRVVRHIWNHVDDKKAFLGGAEEEYNVEVTNRVDTGSWNSPAGATGSFHMFQLTGNKHGGPYISGSHIVSGTVALNSDGSNPVAGATVRIIRQSDNGILQTTSSISGSYSFSVASGSAYHVVAEYISGSQRHNWRSLFDITASAP